MGLIVGGSQGGLRQSGDPLEDVGRAPMVFVGVIKILFLSKTCGSFGN
jgi:hypothetical protein